MVSQITALNTVTSDENFFLDEKYYQLVEQLSCQISWEDKLRGLPSAHDFPKSKLIDAWDNWLNEVSHINHYLYSDDSLLTKAMSYFGVERISELPTSVDMSSLEAVTPECLQDLRNRLKVINNDPLFKALRNVTQHIDDNLEQDSPINSIIDIAKKSIKAAHDKLKSQQGVEGVKNNAKIELHTLARTEFNKDNKVHLAMRKNADLKMRLLELLDLVNYVPPVVGWGYVGYKSSNTQTMFSTLKIGIRKESDTGMAEKVYPNT